LERKTRGKKERKEEEEREKIYFIVA